MERLILLVLFSSFTKITDSLLAFIQSNISLHVGEGYRYPKTQKMCLNLSCIFWLRAMKRIRAGVEHVACEQALCLGKGWKNRGEREGKGCQQSVFSPIGLGACIRICFTAGAVERRSQMFVYVLSPFPVPLSFSPFPQTKSLSTGYGVRNMRVKRVWITGHSKCRSPLLFSSFDDISLKKYGQFAITPISFWRSITWVKAWNFEQAISLSLVSWPKK